MLSLFWLQCYDTYNRQFQSSQIPTFPSHHSMNGRCYLWKTAKALLFLCRYQSASNQKTSWSDRASSISLFIHNKENAVHHMKNWKYLRRNRKVLQYFVITTNVCSIQYSHKSKSTTLQLHFARHLPSWIFPHLRPIVHSPILIWRIENTCGDIEKFCTLSGLYKNPHLFLQLGTNDPPTR